MVGFSFACQHKTQPFTQVTRNRHTLHAVIKKRWKPPKVVQLSSCEGTVFSASPLWQFSELFRDGLCIAPLVYFLFKTKQKFWEQMDGNHLEGFLKWGQFKRSCFHIHMIKRSFSEHTPKINSCAIVIACTSGSWDIREQRFPGLHFILSLPRLWLMHG